MSTITLGAGGTAFASAGGTLGGTRLAPAAASVMLDTTDLGTTNAVLYHRYASKQNANDQTANAANGTVTGPTIGDFGYSFGGGTNRISVADQTALHITNSSGGTFCVECWVNASGLTSYPRLVDKDGSSGSGGWYTCQDKSYRMRDNNGSGLTASTNPTIGSWVHLATSWDGTTWRNFYNGAADGSSLSVPVISASNTNTLYVGNRYNNAAYDRPYSGLMDEVRVCNAATYTAAFTPYRFPVSGTYTVVLDGGSAGWVWSNISFAVSTNSTDTISQIRYQAGDSNPPGLGSATTIGSPSTSNTISATGRYLEVEVTLHSSTDTNRLYTPSLTMLSGTGVAGTTSSRRRRLLCCGS